MNIQPVGNRDRCGKCESRHGGNNHLCDVHGAVSGGCCKTSCKRNEWAILYNMTENDQIINTSKVKKSNIPSHYSRNGSAFGLDRYTSVNWPPAER